MQIRNINRVITTEGDTSDIINVVMYAYDSETDPQIKVLAEQLRGATDYETCQNIWQYLIDNITYKADSDGTNGELVRSPARLVHDGVGDCKSYSIFTATVLRYLGIPCVFRFASYSNKKEATHVYIVAQGNIIIDAVAHVQLNYDFNQEVKYTYHCDMANGKTKISYLAGLQNPVIGKIPKIGKPGAVIPLSGAKFLDNSLARYEMLYENNPSAENLFSLRLIRLVIRVCSYYNLNADAILLAASTISYMATNSDFYNLPDNELFDKFLRLENTGEFPDIDSNIYNTIVNFVVTNSPKNLKSIKGIGVTSKSIFAALNAYSAMYFFLLFYTEDEITTKFNNASYLLKKRKYMKIFVDVFADRANWTEAFLREKCREQIEAKFGKISDLKQKIESGTFNQPAISQYILTNTQNLENVFDIWFYPIKDGIIDFDTEMTTSVSQWDLGENEVDNPIDNGSGNNQNNGSNGGQNDIVGATDYTPYLIGGGILLAVLFMNKNSDKK